MKSKKCFAFDWRLFGNVKRHKIIKHQGILLDYTWTIGPVMLRPALPPRAAKIAVAWACLLGSTGATARTLMAWFSPPQCSATKIMVRMTAPAIRMPNACVCSRRLFASSATKYTSKVNFLKTSEKWIIKLGFSLFWRICTSTGEHSVFSLELAKKIIKNLIEWDLIEWMYGTKCYNFSHSVLCQFPWLIFWPSVS